MQKKKKEPLWPMIVTGVAIAIGFAFAVFVIPKYQTPKNGSLLPGTTTPTAKP